MIPSDILHQNRRHRSRGGSCREICLGTPARAATFCLIRAATYYQTVAIVLHCVSAQCASRAAARCRRRHAAQDSQGIELLLAGGNRPQPCGLQRSSLFSSAGETSARQDCIATTPGAAQPSLMVYDALKRRPPSPLPRDHPGRLITTANPPWHGAGGQEGEERATRTSTAWR